MLVRARGLGEAHALSRVYDTILSFYRAVTLHAAAVPGGHRPPCREIADLLDRFPQHRHWTSRLECADGVPSPVPVLAGASVAQSHSTGSSAPTSATVCRTPRRRLRCSASIPARDRTVALVLRPRAGVDGIVVSRWFDETGVERRRVAGRLGDGAHAIAMWELRPWPGRWVVRTSVDGRPAGDFGFTID